MVIRSRQAALYVAVLTACLWGPAPPALADGGAAMPGDLIISGEYLGRGVECAQLRLTDGEQISLQGVNLTQTAKGTVLTLTGNFVRMSTCMQGRTFQISAVTATTPP